MRTIKNAVLVYGLVNVPVGVATAAKRKDVSFRTLHGECSTPTKDRKFCTTCDRQVEKDELIRGYEFTKNAIFPLNDEKMDSLAAERGAIIRIKKFVPFEQVNELAVEKSYYLTPPPKLPGYSLLSECMAGAGVVGIGSQSLWGKETPAMVWASEDSGALILSMLFCHDEVVPDGEIVLVPSSEADLEMGTRLIEMLKGNLEPEVDLVSSSRVRLDEYLTSVVQGAEFEAAEPEEAPLPSINLMDVLAESIAQVQAEREEAA